MAYILFKNGTTKTIPAETGHKLWYGLVHPETLDEHQNAYLLTIKRIYLNRYNAPQSYIDEHQAILDQMSGKPFVRPKYEPALPYKD